MLLASHSTVFLWERGTSRWKQHVQERRRALVCVCSTLQHAHLPTLTSAVQNGRTVSLIATVLQHTEHSGVADKAQWRAWCCRVMHYASAIDRACCDKVCPPKPLWPFPPSLWCCRAAIMGPHTDANLWLFMHVCH